MYVFVLGGVFVLLLIYQYVSRLRHATDDIDHLPDRRSFDEEPWWERAVIARRMSIDAGICRVCGKPTITKCSKCKQVKYCSIVCQRKDWGSNHKFECENLQKQAALAAAAPMASGGPRKPPPLDPNEDAPVPAQCLFPYQHYLQLWHNRSSGRRPPVGLTNLGNNCYANACLQCLLINRPLRAYLEQGLHTSSCNKPHRNEWCLLCELQSLCKRLAEAGSGDEVSVRPLLRHLRKFSKTLSYGRQEDAHDFFYSMVMTMEAIQLTNYGGKDRFDIRSQETTLVHHAFGGYMRNQVVCGGCGAASRRYEVALDLTLALAGVDRLEDALAQFTAEEVLDGEDRYACDACKQKCRATKWTRFEVAPNSLVLNLKRYGTGRFGKINKPLLYGETLDLGPAMADGAMDPGPATYSLAAVLVHLDQMNSTSFGHYICFVRSGDGRWYVCDDARVAPTSTSRVLSQNAYMLFYQRDTPKPAPQPGFKRERPLLPPTAAQILAAAAAAAAAGQQQLELPQLEVNGSGVAEHLHDLEQEPDQQQHQVQQQQVQQPQVQQPHHGMSLSEMANERLARVSTAPAALARLAEPAGSSSRDEEELSSLASSSFTADADVSDAAATPLDTPGWRGRHRISLSSSSCSSSLPEQQQGLGRQQGDAAAAGAAMGALEPGASAARQQLQQPEQDAAGGSVATPGDASLPAVRYDLSRSGPELLLLRAHLPGVTSAAEVAVDVVSAGPQLQRLQLKLPGRFAAMDVPLSGLLDAQAVAAVSGKLYRRRQLLHIKLHLVDSCSSRSGGDAGGNGQQEAAAGAAGEVAAAGASRAGESASSGASASGLNDGVVHWHSTDAGWESSSGSESDGLLVPASSFHEVLSEVDLSAFFGRHIDARARQMMQQLRSGQAASDTAAAAAPDGRSASSTGGKKSSSKKGGSSSSKKGGSRGKKKR